MHKLVLSNTTEENYLSAQTTVLHPPHLDSKKSFTTLLSYLGQHFHAERSYIFEITRRNQLNNTYEWCAPGVTPEIDSLQHVSTSIYAPYWLPRFQRHQAVIIRNMDTYRELDRPMYDILKPQNIHTLVTFPIFAETFLIGFIGIDNPPLDQIDIATSLLQIIAPFIAVLIYHRDNIEMLRTDTMRDYQTGLSNRRAVEDFMTHSKQNTAMGFVYCDLNNLKETNDTLGHKAGDKLISSTAHILRCDTPDNVHAYRMGGDEFLLLYPEIDSETFREQVRFLHQVFADHKIQIAIGAAWYPADRPSFDAILEDIDQKMYREKQAYHSHQADKK